MMTGQKGNDRLYYSNEARKTAIRRCRELVVKLGNTKPSDTLTLQDIGDLRHYLMNMDSELQREIRAEAKVSEGKTINSKTYIEWHRQPILHDEDYWNGEYRTYGEMWRGEGYQIDNRSDPCYTDR